MIKQHFLRVILLLSMMLFGCDNSNHNKVVNEPLKVADTGKADEDNQQKVVLDHIKALDAGKLDEAFSFLSEESKQKLEKNGGSSSLSKGANQLKQHKGVKEITIANRKVSGQYTILRVVYSLNDGSELFDNIPLIKEEGNWKIAI